MSKEDYQRICAKLAEASCQERPNEYDTLYSEEQDLLAYWISHAIRPAPGYPLHSRPLSQHSSQSIMVCFEKQTGWMASHGQIKGAMLVAGYVPHNPIAHHWFFKITTTYDLHEASQKVSSLTTYEAWSKYLALPYYRTQINGEREPELQRRIAIASSCQYRYME